MDEYLILPILAVGLLTIFIVIVQNAGNHASSESTAASTKYLPVSKSIIVFCVLFGLVLRIYGLDRSLWLDEFGTLWTIEGSLKQMLERVQSFHGQTPVYYAALWLLTAISGESTIVMRGFSFVLGICSGYMCYTLGNSIFGKRAGIIAAAFYWLSPATIQLEAQARPYALALFMATLMFYGFARAVRTGDRVGRWLFVLGGAGLFVAQYVLIFAACGLAVAYVFMRRVRENYPIRQFALDVGIQIVIAAGSFPHVFSLWNRRSSLTWLGSPNYLALYELIGPFLIAALIPLFVRPGGRTTCRFQGVMLSVFWTAVMFQTVLLYVLAYFDANLLHPRYMVVVIIPMILLAAAALSKLPSNLAVVPIGYWVCFIGVFFLLNFKVYGAFSRAGFQDWKTAVSCLNYYVQQTPEAVLLYRSGFVEEDQFYREEISGAVLAPLRRLNLPATSVIILTYSWDKSWREDYFYRVIVPILERSTVFYFLTCAGCFNEVTGQYPEQLVEWVGRNFPSRFERTVVPVGRGITLYQFAHPSFKRRQQTDSFALHTAVCSSL